MPFAASSAPNPKSVVCLPSPEKVVSREPFGVVAGEGEVVAAGAGFGLAHRNDLAVTLNRHSARHVGAAKVGRLRAVAREARVERAIGVVAGEGEVLADVGGRPRSPR